MAIRLLEDKKAFACDCTPDELEKERKKAKENKVAYRYSGKCENKTKVDIENMKANNIPFVIRLKKPLENIVYNDLIKGSFETAPNEVDSFVILRADGTPTYNFACASDDMTSGVDMVIRGEDHISNTPKQIHIKNQLGYTQETIYAHLPIILNSENKKMSKRDDASSVKWLLENGFLPDAIINYLLLLGNNPPSEIFTLPEAKEWFDLKKISKSPAKFDIDKLKFINREHLKIMDDKKLSMLFGYSDIEIGKLAKLYIDECSTINELDVKIKSIFAPKLFENEWGSEMMLLQSIINNAPMFKTYDEFKSYTMEKSELKGKMLFKPLRLLLTGEENGPELSELYPLIKSYLLEIVS
jgi:glutamyl-tRNA synthetase